MISVKIHRSSRIIAAFCDSDLIGKKFEEDIRQLDCRENFYKDKEVDEDEAIKIMQDQRKEDATFNIVGEESIKAAVKVGIINESDTDKIKGIPFALNLL